ncbi:hypothetical protein C8Q74DRAFT_1364448 [Fomes fomentarius]|nr:hypothetical protein C8Q74DRAFT_1364448 [Fomes fomentarius]
MYEGLGSDPQTLINATFALTTIGQFALLLLGATLLFSHGPQGRTATVVNVVIVTLFSTIPPYLLMYATVIWDTSPPFGLCVTQAALIEGARTMLSTALLTLVVNLMLEIQIFAPPAWIANYTQTLLVIAPYIAFLVFSLSASVLGQQHHNEVRHMPNELACSLQNTTFEIAMQIVVVLTLTTTLCLELYAIVHTIRARRKFNSLHGPSLLSTLQAVRIVSFTLLQAFLLIIRALDIYLPCPGLHIASIFYQALMPLGMFVTFGLQEHCINAWKRCFTSISRCPEKQPQYPSRVYVTVTVEKEIVDFEYDPVKPKLRSPVLDQPIHVHLPLQT